MKLKRKGFVRMDGQEWLKNDGTKGMSMKGSFAHDGKIFLFDVVCVKEGEGFEPMVYFNKDNVPTLFLNFAILEK